MDGNDQRWTWGLIGWFVVCAVGAAGCWFFVLLMVTFGCDSGWQGCEAAGMTTLLVYSGMAALGLIALLIWGLVKPLKGVRVAVLLLMPAWVLSAVVLSFFAYWALARGALS